MQHKAQQSRLLGRAVIGLLALAALALIGASDSPPFGRNVSCARFVESENALAYAAGLLDGAQAFGVSFRSDMYRLRKDGEEELAERSLFVADAIAELLAHAKGQDASALAERMTTTCTTDSEGAAQLHFLLALDGWRRSGGS